MFSLQQQSQGFDYRFGVYGSNLGIIDPSKFVILIDSSSASASEVTSAALKDLGIATLMGGQTYGKGVGQNVIGLLDGSGVYITSFELLSPLAIPGTTWESVQTIPSVLFFQPPRLTTPCSRQRLNSSRQAASAKPQPAVAPQNLKLLLSVPPYFHPWDGEVARTCNSSLLLDFKRRKLLTS